MATQHDPDVAAVMAVAAANVEERIIPRFADNMRRFDTGAQRDTDTEKLNFDGALSPLVIERFAQYMHSHRSQPDGSIRDEGNWKKGMPFVSFMQSGWRHFFQWWKIHQNGSIAAGTGDSDLVEEALCGVLFNAAGYLHELLKRKQFQNTTDDQAFAQAAAQIHDAFAKENERQKRVSAGHAVTTQPRDSILCPAS